MRATGIHHVSVHSRNLADSVAFYTGVFGMERIRTPEFRRPTAWLWLGGHEVHVSERETSAAQGGG